MRPAALIRPLLLASLLGSTAVLAGCLLAPSGVQVPAVGTALTASIWESFMPTYKAGMAFTYVNTSKVGSEAETSSDSTKEILKVENGVATYKATVEGATMEATMSAVPKLDEHLSLKSEGPEDVTVPAGTFKGAAKFSGANSEPGSTLTYWLVPGKGYVKTVATSVVNGTTATWTSELKEFKN